MEKIIKSKSTELIVCACGCGKSRKRYDQKGREFTFISGHNDAWKYKRLPPIICPMCGIEFRRKNNKQKVCSMACRRLRNKQARPYQARQVEVNCFTCGAKFMRKKSNVSERSFCSKECKNQWMSEIYSNNNITRPVKLAKIRDENKCRICAFDVVVEVHHIIARRHGGTDDLNNLITLCPNHHALADRQIISIKELQKLIAPKGV